MFLDISHVCPGNAPSGPPGTDGGTDKIALKTTSKNTCFCHILICFAMLCYAFAMLCFVFATSCYAFDMIYYVLLECFAVPATLRMAHASIRIVVKIFWADLTG